jgi:hypothetical protein
LVIGGLDVWPADVYAGQAARHGADQGRRLAAQLGVCLAPDASHHQDKQDQDESTDDEDEDDQGWKHQLSTPLPGVRSSNAIALASIRVPSFA